LLRIESMAGQGDRVRLIDERDSFFSRARQFDNTILLGACASNSAPMD